VYAGTKLFVCIKRAAWLASASVEGETACTTTHTAARQMTTMTRSITSKDIQMLKITHSCCANRLQRLPHSMVVSSGGAVSCWNTEHHWTPSTSNYPAIQSRIQAPLGQQGNWSHAGGKRTADTLDRCYSEKAASQIKEANRRKYRGGTLLLPRTVARLSFSWTGFPWPSHGGRGPCVVLLVLEGACRKEFV
jgi:hypothetical protein